MANKKLKDMPLVEIRQSTYELDDVLRRLSSINTNDSNVYNDFAEIILCLSNEIRDIKNRLEILTKQ